MANPASTKVNVLDEYRAAAAANPQNAWAQTNLGWGLYGRGQFEDAVKAFTDALSVNADLFDAHYGLGLTYKKWGRAGEAVSAFKKTLELLTASKDQARTQIMSRIVNSHLADLHAKS